MATEDPTIAEVEPHSVSVQPDYDLGGVVLEVTDQAGAGFKTIFDQLVALDVAVRIAGAIARLRGWSTS
jgi:hypothetical protein